MTRFPRLPLGHTCWALLLLAGCGASHDQAEHWPPGETPELGADPLAELLRGEAQRALLCARDGDDPVRDVACDGDGSLLQVRSLREAYDLLDLHPGEGRVDEGVVLSAHTTALSVRSVSAVNPRAILLRRPTAGRMRELMALAYTRGEQAIELVVRDRATEQLRFYVLSYAQACNDAAGGCSPADLLTDATESGWGSLSLYDDRDLRGTVLDCAPCHQPDGPGSEPILRMFETEAPFTHWLWRHGHGGQALLADYEAAHGRSAYAGVPYDAIFHTEPGQLVSYLRLEGFGKQPQFFNSAAIEYEVSQSAEGQPFDNSELGDSPTWMRAHRAVLEDAAPPLPYHDVKVSDPDRLAFLTDAYARHRRGDLDDDALPDIRDVLPRDPERLSHLGLMPDADLEGEELLRAACGRCHNGRLDQDVTRARFDVDALDADSRAEAVKRLSRAPDARGAMPPPRLMLLTDAQRAELLALLGQE